MSAPPRAPVVLVVGRGRVGRTLAARLRAAGVETTLARGRAPGPPKRAIERADILWLAVPDPTIPEVEARVAALLPDSRALGLRAPVVAHASGALGPDILAQCRARGAVVAAAHPAVSFGSTRTALEGTAFVIDGDPSAVRALSKLARRLGALPLALPAHGPRYHAALALAANGAAALSSVAVAMLTEVGLRRPDAARLVGALVRSVGENVTRVGPEAALTGPIARGDAPTVARHLAALRGSRRDDYLAVARLVLRVAEARGLAPDAAKELARLLAEPGRPDPSSPRRR